MKNYYAKKKEDAVEVLAILTGDEVHNSKEGVRAALAEALRTGTPRMTATAVMAASKWCWAHNECEEEDYKALVAKTSEAEHADTAHAEQAEHIEHVEAAHAEQAAASTAAVPASK